MCSDMICPACPGEWGLCPLCEEFGNERYEMEFTSSSDDEGDEDDDNPDDGEERVVGRKKGEAPPNKKRKTGNEKKWNSYPEERSP